MILRGAILLFGACYLFFRAWAMRADAAGDPERLGAVQALVLAQALVGVICLAAAAVAFLALRPRPRRRTLTLEDLRGPREGPPPAPPGG